jgi:kynurenine formamidase
MSKYIDLSHTIENGMPVHPYDDKTRLYRNRFLDKDKYNDSRLETGMHAGTHIDVPSHLIDRDTLISDYPLDKFIGNGCLLDVRNQEVITMKEEYRALIKENDIVILYTGFDQHFGNESYFNSYPVVEKQLAQFFIEKGVKMVGMDLPSPDKYPFEIHKMLFEKDILIIENLTNLGSLANAAKFEVIALPLKIKAEASQVRVVAKIKKYY